MVQIAQPHQYPIRKFADLQQGAAALSALQDGGFSGERLSLVPEALNATPKLSQTEAANNAGKGAIAGTLLGAIAGLMISAFSVNDPASPTMAPVTQLLSFALIASGIGAAGGAAIAGITGGSVDKEAASSDPEAEQTYLLLIDGTTPEEAQKAQQILQQLDR